MKRYNNYHKHDHISNIFTPDTNAHFIDYVNRAIELGEPNVWTTNHGSGGDIFEAKQLADANGLNVKFGIEGYIVPNPLEKDPRNYHIILIPRTNIARKKLNLASSHANIEGYYYKPRFFIKDLLNFNKEELYITTACVAGLLRDNDSYNEIFLPLVNHFGENIFLEVQNHNEDIQKDINTKALWCMEEHGLKLISANDSHYIYPEQSKERLELLKGKGISYTDEDSFILDYPDYEVLYDRYIQQGILTKEQISMAIDNTLLFDDVENIEITMDIKMPTIYPNKTDEEKYQILVNCLNERFYNVMDRDNISEEKRQEYIDECKKELQVIYDTKDEIHTPDYFLLNINVIDKAINEYGGVLTRTGRGSCGSFLINKILGITQIDRLTVNLPMYSDRFMSTARLLENKALPDIDFNLAEQEPFVKATRDLLGEHGCYPMVAYGTMKLSEAFRNVCRSHEIPFDDYNNIAKSIETVVPNEWKEYVDEANKYVGTIISASVHPCAHLLLNEDIRAEIGVVRLGDNICTLITSNEADGWKYLKNDYLIVTVWDIISKVFNMIDKPIMTIKELLNNIDEKVWKLFDNGLTCTLNQVDGQWATDLLMKFKPRTVEELSMFVAAIRPSFESLRDDFIDRKPYTTGSKYLDELFSNTYNRCCFQENIMKYFEWLGVSPADSIGIIKKISKKKIHKEDFDKLEERLKEQWKINTGSYEDFDESWADMQSNMKYSFNSPHGLATALDCLYCAYLKANYPVEYYTVVFNLYRDDGAKSERLTKECKYFNIQIKSPIFRHSTSEYTCDVENKIIYKGIGSIKNIGENCGNNLYTLKDGHFNCFTFLLWEIFTKKLANKTEIEKLIKIDFFKEFGDINLLLQTFEIFKQLFKRKSFRIADLETYNLTKDEVLKFADKATEKQFSGIDMESLIGYICSKIKYIPITNIERMSNNMGILGYTDLVDNTIDENILIVGNIETNKYGNKFATLYSPKYGEYYQRKINKYSYADHPCDSGDIIKVVFNTQFKRKQVDGEWTKSDEKETILKNFSIIKSFKEE